MTELAVPEQHVPAVAAPTESTPFTIRKQSLAEWARDAEVAFQLATQLAATSFIPSTMRGKVDDITACLLAGNELGLPPMAALKSMDVIHGTPGLRAHAMRGLVQSHGHDVEVVASTDVMCQMRGRRKGSEEWQTSTWTIGRAQLAGYVAKNAMYKTQPANMLAARATGEVCRWIASDVLHGVPYNSEELRDSVPQVTAVRVGAPATAAEILGRRTASESAAKPEALTAGEPQPEVDADEGTADAELANESPAPLNGWQLAWQAVGVAVSPLGWDQAKAKAEFTQYMNMELEHSSVDDLQTFTEHVQTLVAAEGGAE